MVLICHRGLLDGCARSVEGISRVLNVVQPSWDLDDVVCIGACVESTRPLVGDSEIMQGSDMDTWDACKGLLGQWTGSCDYQYDLSAKQIQVKLAVYGVVWLDSLNISRG